MTSESLDAKQLKVGLCIENCEFLHEFYDHYASTKCMSLRPSKERRREGREGENKINGIGERNCVRSNMRNWERLVIVTTCGRALEISGEEMRASHLDVT